MKPAGGGDQAPANMSAGTCIRTEFAGDMLGQFGRTPHELGLQVNAALVRQDDDRPQTVRQLVAELGLALRGIHQINGDVPDKSVDPLFQRATDVFVCKKCNTLDALWSVQV